MLTALRRVRENSFRRKNILNVGQAGCSEGIRPFPFAPRAQVCYDWCMYVKAKEKPPIRLSLFVDADLHEKARVAAAKQNVPVYRIVGDILRTHFKRKDHWEEIAKKKAPVN